MPNYKKVDMFWGLGSVFCALAQLLVLQGRLQAFLGGVLVAFWLPRALGDSNFLLSPAVWVPC